jgi:hypothetical protein
MKAQYRMRMKKATILGPGARALRENISNSRSLSLPKIESLKGRKICKLLNPKKAKKVKEWWRQKVTITSKHGQHRYYHSQTKPKKFIIVNL